MFKNKSVGVVIPAYNEEKNILRVINTLPDFIDYIIIVDDFSSDNTSCLIEKEMNNNSKIFLIKHSYNKGAGSARMAGYEYARRENIDIVAAMDADGQMDPGELESLCLPIAEGKADYVKGNRLVYDGAWNIMPRYRFIGNSILSLLTKIASGYWFLTDTQTGYTAISRRALKQLNLSKIYPRYGFLNDIFIKLNVIQARIKEIPIKPIYHPDGKSGIRLMEVIPKISWLLFKGFFWRLKERYIIRDFHPLVFFYYFSFFLILTDLALIVRLFIILFETGRVAPINMLAIILVSITSLQFLLFAMWFDMDYNKELRIR